MPRVAGQFPLLNRAQNARPVLAECPAVGTASRLREAVEQDDGGAWDLAFPDLTNGMWRDSRLFGDFLKLSARLIEECSDNSVVTSDVDGVGDCHGTPVLIWGKEPPLEIAKVMNIPGDAAPGIPLTEVGPETSLRFLPKGREEGNHQEARHVTPTQHYRPDGRFG